MSDVAMARSYVEQIGGGGNVQTMLRRVYEFLARMFPHEKDPKEQWTERRVRSFWNEEAATVQYREMVELHRAAEEARAERARLKLARERHAAFIEETVAYRAFLERRRAVNAGDLAP